MIGPTHICGVIDNDFEWMAKVRHRDSLENPPADIRSGGAVLGSRFNIFSMPNDLGLSRGAIVYAEAVAPLAPVRCATAWSCLFS
jgi:hypothetical protein